MAHAMIISDNTATLPPSVGNKSPAGQGFWHPIMTLAFCLNSDQFYSPKSVWSGETQCIRLLCRSLFGIFPNKAIYHLKMEVIPVYFLTSIQCPVDNKNVAHSLPKSQHRSSFTISQIYGCSFNTTEPGQLSLHLSCTWCSTQMPWV